MSPVRALAVLLLALSLLTGCGGDEEVARVGDTEFHLSDVAALFEGGAVPADDFRMVLYRLIAVEVLNRSLEADFGTAVEPEQVEANLATLEDALEQSGQTPAQYLGMENVSRRMLRFNAEVVALRDVAIEQLLRDPGVVDGLFADPAALTTVCSRHIMTATEEEAEAAAARLAAGEDFAVVADEVSVDTSAPGGELGCALATAFVPGYTEAALSAVIGEVTGPVATEYGYHLLLVYERTAPTREEYLADPRSAISDEALATVWSDWFNTEMGAAEVWVSPEYGSWTGAMIVPPPAGE